LQTSKPLLFGVAWEPEVSGFKCLYNRILVQCNYREWPSPT
jgi:hypothetical protein